MRIATAAPVFDGITVCSSGVIGGGLCSGAGSAATAMGFSVKAAVSGDAAVCGSSVLGGELCSGAGAGVVGTDVSSGVSTMIRSERGGAGVFSLLGVALATRAGDRVAS